MRSIVLSLAAVTALLTVPGAAIETASAACDAAAVPQATQAAAPQARLDLFARGADNALWHRYWTQGSPWTCWESLRGDLASAAGVASHDAGVLHLAALGPDHRMLDRSFLNSGGIAGGWSTWNQLGDQEFASAPAPASWGSSHFEVFVRGTDNQIWHNWFRFGGGGWSGWYALDGGSFQGAPAAAAYAPERLHVFAWGTDGRIWQRYLVSSSTWSAWQPLGNQQFASSPSAVSWGSDHLEVFARGLDNRSWHNWYRFGGGGWSGWYALDGGSFQEAPAAGSWGPGALNLFALGTDGRIWQRYLLGSGTWSAWTPMGDETFTSSPTTASWSKWEAS